MLGAVVAVVVYAIAKQALGQRVPDKEEAIEIATDAPEDPAAAAARQVETDVQRLLDRARAAAASGDYGAAVGDAYAALLRKLEGAHLVTIESHRTNGDHVRDVGRQLPALRQRMQGVVSNVEQVQFGGDAPSEGHYRSVMSGVVGLLAERLAACLPFVINLGLGIGLATLVAGCSVDRDRWDHSPSGRAGVIDLLQRYGFTPRERLTTLSKIDKSVSTLVLLPGATVDDASWTAIATWTGAGGAADRRGRAPHPSRLGRRAARGRWRRPGVAGPAHRTGVRVRSLAPAQGRRAGRATGEARAATRDFGQGRRPRGQGGDDGATTTRSHTRRRPRCSRAARRRTPWRAPTRAAAARSCSRTIGC